MAHRFADIRVGLQKTSTIDFPRTVAATIFFTGCNLRCPFCHNPLLAQGVTPLDFRPLDEALALIARRRSVLGGVCLTGGEPLLQPVLWDLVSEIQSHGLPVKIDTNGLSPDRLAQMKPDYTAVDLKTSPARYHELAEATAQSHCMSQVSGASDVGGAVIDSRPPLFDAVRRTMQYLRSAGKPYEYRTTVVPGLVEQNEFEELCGELDVGERWILQRFRPDTALSRRCRALLPPSTEELVAMRDYAMQQGIACQLRGVGS